MNHKHGSYCQQHPGDHCYEEDCKMLKTCPELKVSPHKYPVVQPRHQCQYIDSKDIRCRRMAYYLIPVKNAAEQYRCILDSPLRYRLPQFKIRRPKGDRPLHT